MFAQFISIFPLACWLQPMEFQRGKRGFYSPEAARETFAKFRERFKIELEIAAVQERVKSKLTGKPSNTFEMNFYKEELTEGALLEECLSQSTELSYKLSDEPEYETETRKTQNKTGLIDDVADYSGSEDIETDGSYEDDGFIAQSSECEDGMEPEIVNEKYMENDEREIRKLKRRFTTRRVNHNKERHVMEQEENSESSSIAEIDLGEGLTSELDIKERGTEKKTVTVEEERKAFKDDNLFERNNEAIERLKRETTGWAGFKKETKN